MEKIGGNIQGKPRAGLLSFATRLKPFFLGCLLCLCALSLFAAETEMLMSGQPFVAGEPFTVSFLFYGVSPDAVFWEGDSTADYMEEAFPPSFSVETVKKSSLVLPRQGAFGSSESRAVLVAIEAIPKEAGEFVIGPFSFRAGGERVAFPPARVLVESASGGQQGESLRLFWLVQERQGSRLIAPSEASDIEAGREALIVLMVPAAAKGSISCPAPENALLEATVANPIAIADLLPAGATGEYSPAAAYIWTPLFQGRQSLPRAVFSFAESGATFFSEEAEIEVVAPPLAQGAPPPTQGQLPDALPTAQPSLKKPDELYPLDTDSRFEANLAEKVSRLWDEGQHAKAAVILRSAENAYPFRQRIAEMRLAADAALNVEGKSAGTLERALFFAPFMLILLDVILFAALFISWAVSGKKDGKRSAFFGKKLIIACAIFAALGTGGALYASLSGGMEEAAATGGFLRSVPDAEAAVATALKAGAPLKIESRTPSWLYARTLSGDAGWYPSSEIIVYKTGDLHEFR